MRHCFHMLGAGSVLGIGLLLALEAGAAERGEAFARLSPAHMHYLKSCFALERGDITKARDELRLAQILDEYSPYLRLAMQRHKVLLSPSEERLRGELHIPLKSEIGLEQQRADVVRQQTTAAGF